LVIVVLAFALRLAWLLYAKGEPPRDWLQAGDQYSYWYYGNEIAAGRGYVSYITNQPTAYYPIGYPALLAVLFFTVDHLHLTSHLLLTAGLLHVAISTATVALVFVIGRRVWNPTVGLIAAALLAVFPNAIFQVASLQVETMFVFLSVAALAVIVEHDWSSGLPSRNRLLAFGAVLGASVLVRPFSVWFLVGLYLAALAVGAGWRKAGSMTLVPALVVVAMSVPWIVRNEVRMHAFIPTSTNTGDTLCLDRNSTAQGGFRFADHDGCVDPNLPEVPRNNGNTRKAISFVIHHPAREALQIVRRARIEFDSDSDGLFATQSLGGGPALGSRTYKALSTIADWYFFVMLGLGALGPPLLFRRARASEWRIVFVGFSSMFVIPLLLWGNQRFHVPLLPFLALFGAAALHRVATWFGERRSTAT
jgi:4-amino-4-deoxy-L-arabinose transferase-like glycosyltransferase